MNNEYSNSIVGTYSWPFHSTPEDIASGRSDVLRCDEVWNNYRIVGMTSDGHRFKTTLGLWRMHNIPATDQDFLTAAARQ